MIDWHSHVLPGMDDGSRDVAESISMLDMQRAQGVSTVIATPHFYANDESVDAFLERRSTSYAKLQTALPPETPQVLLGAEVRYYPGISRLERIDALKIEGSRLLLLEMPMATWTEYMVRELAELSGNSSFRIVLAHVERYLKLQTPAVLERIYENGILTQVNASFFAAFATKHKAISMLREGRIHFVGSDCHNMTSRPPQLGRAYEVIQKKLGREYAGQMCEYGYSMLATSK